MVNYCCVYGCGRNSRVSKHLNYYSLPKGKDRQEQWLRAAGRDDLLQKMTSSSTRFCSRHFSPSQIRRKHLSPDAVPSLCLPGSLVNDNQDTEPPKHVGVVCNGCSDPVVGFRYKCIACPDYDLCQKCETLGVHPDHLLLRIPKPMKFKKADILITKCRDLVKTEQDKSDNSNSDNEADVYLSSDDEPITKYTKEYDSGVDLPDDVKRRIRSEVSRVLNIINTEQESEKDTSKKRPSEINRPSKKLRTEGTNEKSRETSNTIVEIEELAFADVDEVKIDKVKDEANISPSTELKEDKDLYEVLSNMV